MTNLFSDLRYAVRTLGRNPTFTAIVVLVLGIGIGANTAMFSIVNDVLLRPLPFRNPSRLVAVQESVVHAAQAGAPVPVNAVHFEEWRRLWSSADQIAMLSTMDANLTSGGEPEDIPVGRVSSNLFSTLGIQPRIGRSFTPEEDRPGNDTEVILSDSLWQRRFHGDPGIVGSRILLNDVPYEVVGVLPPGLQIPKVSELQSMAFGSQIPELWRPFGLRDDERSPMGDFDYACIARLKDAVPLTQAIDELNGIQTTVGRTMANAELRAVVTPLQEQMTGGSRRSLMLLLLAVGAVLLIVCVNVANLLLARAAGRRHEFALRMAIGASTSRLLLQALTESLTVSLLGGVLGSAIAVAALQAMASRAPIDLPRLNELHPGGGIFAVAFILSLASAIVCGITPAWVSSRVDPQIGLRSGGRSITDNKRSRRLRSLLVSIETALCAICLVAAGLLLNSFVRLLRVDTGFNTEHVLTMDLNMPEGHYPDTAHRSQFLQKAIDSTRTLPGVQAVGVSNLLPLAGEGSNNIISLDGDTTPFMQRPIADFRMVNEQFFQAMGIPLLQGRPLQPSDGTRRVSVISLALATRLWPNENPLGRMFHLGAPNGPPVEVVGVAGDVRGVHLQTAPNPTVYLPYWQRDRAGMSLIVRTERNPELVAESLRHVIQSLDREMAVPQYRTLDEIVFASVALRRFQLTLVLLFASMALILAGLGIYGVVSYTVTERRCEMEIRMALGASGADVRGLVLRQGLRPVALGLISGLIGAVAIGRVLQSLLFGVSAGDPLTFSAVAVVLLIVAAIACYVPAARATGLNPLIILRQD